VVARLGGEEFGICLPETKQQKAQLIAERLRELIGNMVINMGEESLTFSISMGITQVSLQDPSIEATLARADDALYLAKDRGRDRVCVADLPAMVGSSSLP